MRSPLRILDANLNRAREALRVMEDAARFLLDDAALGAALKSMRHEMTAAAASLPAFDAHRDAASDVGAPLSHASERSRRDARDVVTAAAKRLGEALRSLEEYGKLVDESFAARMKALRYRAYEAETALLAKLPRNDASSWRVCVLLTESLCAGRPWEQIAEQAIAGGADAIQLREKSLDDADLLRRARRLVELAAGRAAVVINDRIDIALASGADGVHLGQEDLPIDAARALVGRRLLIGASTHDLDEATRAIAAGVDYCGVGAMFETTTKPERTPSGVAYLSQFIATHPDVPHLAIGGITPENIAALIAAGCRGIAVGASVCSAPDPATATRRLLHAFESPSHAAETPRHPRPPQAPPTPNS